MFSQTFLQLQKHWIWSMVTTSKESRSSFNTEEADLDNTVTVIISYKTKCFHDPGATSQHTES